MSKWLFCVVMVGLGTLSIGPERPRAIGLRMLLARSASSNDDGLDFDTRRGPAAPPGQLCPPRIWNEPGYMTTQSRERERPTQRMARLPSRIAARNHAEAAASLEDVVVEPVGSAPLMQR